MSSKKTPYVFDPAEISIRDWSWSIEQIETAHVTTLTSHYEEFKTKKNEALEVLGSARLYQYDVDAYLDLDKSNPLRSILELRTWLPIDPEEFFDWCYSYEWKVRRQISFLEKRAALKRARRLKGIERHPGKWAPKKRRATNKGEPKMVSLRNFERLQRKWERGIIDSVKSTGFVQSSYWHPNFILSLDAERFLSETKREISAHEKRVKEREAAQSLHTKQRVEELKRAAI